KLKWLSGWWLRQWQLGQFNFVRANYLEIFLRTVQTPSPAKKRMHNRHADCESRPHGKNKSRTARAQPMPLLTSSLSFGILIHQLASSRFGGCGRIDLKNLPRCRSCAPIRPKWKGTPVDTGTVPMA